MNRLLKAVHKFCTDMDMKLAVEKTVILAYGTNQNRWKVTEGEPDIEQALVAKYLGIEVNIQGRNLIKPCESKMIGTHLRSHYHGLHSVRLG